MNNEIVMKAQSDRIRQHGIRSEAVGAYCCVIPTCSYMKRTTLHLSSTLVMTVIKGSISKSIRKTWAYMCNLK